MSLVPEAGMRTRIKIAIYARLRPIETVPVHGFLDLKCQKMPKIICAQPYDSP